MSAHTAPAQLTYSDCPTTVSPVAIPLIMPLAAPTVLDLLDVQCAASPQAVAVACAGESITYAELQERARQLAASLQQAGAQRGAVVALWLPRSLHSIVASYAVMLTGAAYAPFDTGMPAGRLLPMLEDAAAQVVLTTPALLPSVPAGPWTATTVDAAFATPVAPFIPSHVTGSDLAYIIVTSGSTGRPKGVEIEHSALLNLSRWHSAFYGVLPGVRATQIASPGFDAAVAEIWPYLTRGATLLIPDNDTRLSPEALAAWLVQQRVNVAFVPTQIGEQLLDVPWPPNAALRFLLTAGDTLHRFPPAGLPFQFVNNYGPTENTVATTAGVVPPGGDGYALPGIGWPVTGVQLHVLDAERQPVAPGQPGELYIGGASLARGYRNQPELTAERFVPNPFQPGERLYRTGDLVSQRPDGSYSFIGRNDLQVKIRGQRIELGEIDAAVQGHPDIVTCVTSAVDAGPTGMRLVAYVVLHAGATWAPVDLRMYLASKLPDAMVPTTYVRLQHVPLSSNGKVDRAALPDASSESPLRVAAYRAPETPIELHLATLMTSLLNVPTVSVDDDFFYLGGHSLLATQLIARIQDAYDVKLSLHTVFDTSTVAGLAEAIDEALLEKVGAMSEAEAEQLLV